MNLTPNQKMKAVLRIQLQVHFMTPTRILSLVPFIVIDDEDDGDAHDENEDPKDHEAVPESSTQTATSSAAVPDQGGSAIFTSGKNTGHTFKEITQRAPHYYFWAQRQMNPSEMHAKYLTWVESNYIIGMKNRVILNETERLQADAERPR